MNYSPKSYIDILNSINSIDDYASEISNVSFDIDNDEAKEDLQEIEKEIGKKAESIRKISSMSVSQIETLIYQDYVQSQERYIELVSIGYEKDLFPFQEWLGITKNLSWLTSNNINLANEFKSLGEEKNLQSILMLNIEHIWWAVEYSVENIANKHKFFYDCIDLANNLTPEVREHFIERFIFTKDIEGNLISYLEEHKPLAVYNPDFSKVGFYINYLFKNPLQNEEKLHNVFSKLKSCDNSVILNEITNVLISKHNYNSFLNFWNNNLHQVSNDKLEQLFSLDMEYQLGLSKYIANNLKKVQKQTYSSEAGKLDNIINFFETGSAAFELSQKIAPKQENKTLRKL